MPSHNLPAAYMSAAGIDAVRVIDSGGGEDQPSIILRFSNDQTGAGVSIDGRLADIRQLIIEADLQLSRIARDRGW